MKILKENKGEINLFKTSRYIITNVSFFLTVSLLMVFTELTLHRFK